MRTPRSAVLLIALCVWIACDSGSNALDPEADDGTPEAPTVLNLSFEQSTPDAKPKRWFTSGDGYDVRVVESLAYHGARSLYMGYHSGDGFGVATSNFPVEDARGSTLKLVGHIRTEAVTDDWAGLWMRVDGPGGETLAFDNMSDRGVVGTTDWTRVEIQLPVSQSALSIYFGALLPGNGAAWFDALSFEVGGVAYQPPLVFDPDAAQLTWLQATARPFDTEEPGGSFDDLTFLEDMVGSARIVSLGEGTHGTREFFKMKHRVTEFLATQMGFTVFAIEANMPESRAINRYVLHGEGDPRAALDGIYFWTWNTEEVLDMIEWMRSYNASGQGHIQFLGFDAQNPTVATQNVEAFVDEVEPSFSQMVRASYDIVRRVYADRRRSYSDASVHVDEAAWRREAGAVVSHLEASRVDYLSVKPKHEVDWAIQDARVVLQAAEPRWRDRSMADNVDWILESSPPETRIVLWAHNGHVSKSPGRMGRYLATRHGDEMVVVGFAFHEGSYTAVGSNGLGTYTTAASEAGSAEWAFHSTGQPRLVLDLRLASANDPRSSWLTRTLDFRSIGAVASSYAFFPTVLTDEYDVLIFFDRTTPSRLLAGSTLAAAPVPAHFPGW